MHRPPRPIGHSGSGGVWSFIKSLYRDEFRWSVVKSVGFFALGIAIAREFKGVDLISPQQPQA